MLLPNDQSWAQSSHDWLLERRISFPIGKGSWAYTATNFERLPPQGWKIHVSCHILNALFVLKRVGPYLIENGACAKVSRNLLDLKKLNTGIGDAYSQIGKCFTIYNQTEADFIASIERIYKLLNDLEGPAVPFDLRYRDSRCVFYRFGAFRSTSGDAHLIAPDGALESDLREPNKAIPSWIINPLPDFQPETRLSIAGKLANYPCFEVLSQRGKGGVFKALNTAKIPFELCIVKEGRRLGEISKQGLDGRDRIFRESLALPLLRKRQVRTPQLIDAFEQDGNCYAVLQYIHGRDLIEVITSYRYRSNAFALCNLLISVAKNLARMHGARACWRDLKPQNMIIQPFGKVVFIDMEGAVFFFDPVRDDPWGSKGFLPPEWASAKRADGFKQDVFAFGRLIHFILSGKLRFDFRPISGRGSRQHIDEKTFKRLDAIARKMTHRNPALRPSIGDVLFQLRLTIKPAYGPRRNGRATVIELPHR